MVFLKEILIQNFKSFTNESISLDKVTCIVGANESGKSNLLDAIYHLSPLKQKTQFLPDDLRIGAKDYPSGVIFIMYTLILNEKLLEDLLIFFPELNGKEFIVSKTGKPKEEPQWVGSSSCPLNLLPDILKINHKGNFSKAFNSLGDTEKVLSRKRVTYGWFINDNTVDLRKQPFKKLLDDKIITLLKSHEKRNFIDNLIKEKVLSNIKIYKWGYKEGDFLQEIVSIAELIQNPNKFRTITNIFLIAGWKKNEFSKKLLNHSNTVYSNLINPVERSINSLIKNQWSSHKKLEIEIVHRGEHLTIHLHETGSSTPPEFRSDGLKWFLTFLINFRAQSQDTSNYILLIDEPGLFLHPRGQKDVLDEINNLSKNNQIIYTTHQTFLINKNKPETVRIITRVTDKSGVLANNPFYASKVNNQIDTKSILTDRLLREALGFKVSDISPINEKNILVEGVFDRELFHILNDKWQIIDLNETSFNSCSRASEISKHYGLYKSNDLKVICFYDSDEPGRSAYKNNTKAKASEKLQISDFAPDVYETVEDLIPDAIFDIVLQEWLKKWNKDLEGNVDRPRMKNLDKYFNPIDKIEMKHNLENFIIERIKKENLNSFDFSIIRKILEKFNKSLN